MIVKNRMEFTGIIHQLNIYHHVLSLMLYETVFCETQEEILKMSHIVKVNWVQCHLDPKTLQNIFFFVPQTKQMHIISELPVHKGE